MSETRLATSAPTSAAMVATLSGNAIKLFAALYLNAKNWASHQPQVECGYTLIKTWCKLSNDAIQRCITELEMTGYIKFAAESTQGRRVYILLPDVEILGQNKEPTVPEIGTPHSGNRNGAGRKSERDRSGNRNATVPEIGMENGKSVPISDHVFKEQLFHTETSKKSTYTAVRASESDTTDNKPAAFDNELPKTQTDDEAARYSEGRKRIDQIHKCLKAASPNCRIMCPPPLILDEMAHKVSCDEEWFSDTELIKIARWCVNEQEFETYQSAGLNVEQFIRNLRGIVSRWQATNPTRRRSTTPAEQTPQKPRLDSSELERQWAREIRLGERTWSEIVAIYGEAATREVCERTGFDPLSVKRISVADSAGRGSLGNASDIIAMAGVKRQATQ